MIILFDGKGCKLPKHKNETQYTCNRCNSVFRAFDYELHKVKYKNYPHADVYIVKCPICKKEIIVK